MTAAEARTLSARKPEGHDAERQKLNKLIEAAATSRDQKQDIFYYHDIMPSVRDELRGDGYQLTSLADPREPGEGWRIAWGGYGYKDPTPKPDKGNYKESPKTCTHQGNITTTGGVDQCSLCGKIF